MGRRQNIKPATAEESPVSGSVGFKPMGEVESGFNQEKLAVGILEGNRKVGEVLGDSEEEKSDKPFVVDVVAEAEAAMEVGEWGEDRI